MSDGLLVVGIVIGALALLALVLFVIAPPVPRVSKARRVAPGEERVSGLTRATDRTVATIESVVQRKERGWFGDDALELAGIRMQPSAFLIVVFALGAVLALLGVALTFGSPLSLLVGVLLGAFAPLLAKLYVVSKTAKRRSKFAEQLDDTLQLMSGNLRAGHGLLQSIDSVARDADLPTSEEFARVVNESRIGRDLDDALASTATRMQSDDFTWAAQAIAINRETGGNLAEVLERVATTIRERNQIRRQVRALSAEGRLSATVLILLPIVVFLAVSLTQPAYLVPLYTTLIGIIAMIFAVILLIIGTVWMLAITRVRF